MFVWPEALGDAMVKAGNSTTFVQVWNSISSEGAVALLQYSWVIGHIFGYILLGIALGRARAIPLWAACLIVAGIPFQAAAYISGQGIFQLISYVLIFIGSVPAALAMLKLTNQEGLAHAELEGQA